MRTEFRSRDIQKIIGKQKQRVEYLTRQLRLDPDVEEAEGTGHSNVWSFKRAVQFALAQVMSEHGLSVAHIRRVLAELNLPEKAKYSDLRNCLVRFLAEASVVREFYNENSDDSLFLFMTRDERGTLAVEPVYKIPNPIKTSVDLRVEVIICINLKSIKNRVQEYAHDAS